MSIAEPGLLGVEHREAPSVSDDRDPEPVILQKGMPRGELRLGLRNNRSDDHGTATIPADAIEVALIVP